MPLLVGEPAAGAVVAGGKQRSVRSAWLSEKPAKGVAGERAEPGWYWLIGQPRTPEWVEQEKPLAGAVEVHWTEPLTKAEFDGLKLLDGAGKPVGLGGGGGPLWLDTIDKGREVLASAAAAVLAANPGLKGSALREACAAALNAPGQSWRGACLITAGDKGAVLKPKFDAPSAAVIAAQQEAMWAAGLGRLAKADAALAAKLAVRLLQVASIPAGGSGERFVPVWAEADPHLLDTLLTAPPLSVTTAVASFLAAQPDQIAWVRDDAGLKDAFTGSPLATIGVLSLTDKTRLATLTFDDQAAAAAEPVAVKPFAAVYLSAAARQSGPTSAATLKIGGVSLPVQVAANPATAMPPGQLIGPFWADTTLASFRGERSIQTQGIAGSLVPAIGGGWTLYLESRSIGSEAEAERFRVWAGPSGSPQLSIDITTDGGAARIGSAAVAVSRIPGGWCATVAIAPALIDSSGVIRLGVEHMAASGVRSTWPRPMLPWQTEPGRLAIDLKAWDREVRP